MAIFNISELQTQLSKAEIETDNEGRKFRQVFIDTVFNLLPSGKFYTPYAHSNVTEEEAEKDEDWYAEAEFELDKINAFLVSGEGDPCDLFVVQVVE